MNRLHISLLLAIAILLSVHPPARAEPLGNIRLPDNIAPLPGDAPTRLLDPAPASSAWATPGHRPLGITLANYDLTQEQIEAVRQTGCGMVRLYIPMEHFSAQEDADWATLDQVISRLRRADLEVLAVLDAVLPVGEVDRKLYRQFCRAIAQRYRESLDHYQLLDNINYKLGMSSRDYSDLLAVCSPEIKGADREAVIVTGGIRGCDMTYLDMLELQRALRNLDVIALTLLPQPDGIETVSKLARAEHSLPYVENVMQWARFRGKRVWVTSLGVSTDTTWVGVDEVAQGGMYARGSLVLGALGVERIVFAQIQDNDPTYQIPARCCGLLRVDGQRKASYFVLRALAGVVTGAYHARVPFGYSAQTFQRPAESDIRGIREDQIEYSRRVFTGQVAGAESAFGVQGPLDPFRTHQVDVFSYWFYAPAAQEYRLVYWLTREQPYPALLTLTCENSRLIPLAEHLSPASAFSMLDSAAQKPEFAAAKNLLILPYLKLDTVPCVISFKAIENPRGDQPRVNPLLQPALGQPELPEVPSMRR